MKNAPSWIRLLSFSLRSEFHSVTTSPATLLVVLGGVVLYGVLYHLLYLPNVVRDVPIVVVDQANNQLSHKFIRHLDASPEVMVAEVTSQLPEAQSAMASGRVEATILLPSDMAERIGRGERAPFVLYASTAQLLNYESTARGALQSMLATDLELRTQTMWQLPSDYLATMARRESVTPIGNALFNPSKGYADYLLPAVVVVIIFQTMTMAVATQRGRERGLRRSPLRGIVAENWSRRMAIVGGRCIFYFSTYALLSIFTWGLLPILFNTPHNATATTLIAITVPFILSTHLFAETFGRLFKDSESPLLYITFFSVGLIFLSGISFPLTQMPLSWRILHHILPAPIAIEANIAAASMGASIEQVGPEIALLWGLTILYFLLATIPLKREGRRFAFLVRLCDICTLKKEKTQQWKRENT
ncbi:MAG: ABC transporter permease [Tidjanibacter sp.]|nr:ABC transporter permease [Tidjanibacter sp.]